MNKLTVVKIEPTCIEFKNGIMLYSDHLEDCCESHYLSFEDLSLSDFEGLEFDLSGETFFKRIDNYGIELLPLKGHSVKIPGYGYNNGYYSSDLTLCIEGNGVLKKFDITECQVVKED